MSFVERVWVISLRAGLKINIPRVEFGDIQEATSKRFELLNFWNAEVNE